MCSGVQPQSSLSLALDLNIVTLLSVVNHIGIFFMLYRLVGTGFYDVGH